MNGTSETIATHAAPAGPRGLLRRVAMSAAGTYAAYVLHGLRHPQLLRPGADPRTAAMRLPGDEIVAHPHWRTTFATEIAAPRAVVWPWLVQIGWGRAGWYTWYRYDNGGLPSANQIVPALQDLAVGDVIPDGPRAAEGFGVWRVERLEPPSTMVLVSRREPMTGREVAHGELVPGILIDCSWAFFLEEISPDACRLVVRVRAALEGEHYLRSALVAYGARALFGVGDTVMERTLLEGVKRRAEAAARQRRSGSA